MPSASWLSFGWSVKWQSRFASTLKRIIILPPRSPHFGEPGVGGALTPRLPKRTNVICFYGLHQDGRNEAGDFYPYEPAENL